MLNAPAIPGQGGNGAPPRRKHIWPWVLGCSLALVLVGWLGYVGVMALWRLSEPMRDQLREVSTFLAETNPPAPPAGVRFGTPLSWRVLHQGAWNSLFVGSAACGQFDQDPDAELLVADHDDQARLFQPDGSSSKCGLKLYGFGLHFEPWDYDGDGVDEVVANMSVSEYFGKGFSWESPRAEDGNASLQTPVFNLDGRIVAKLDGWPFFSDQLLGRFTADGPRQLLLMLEVAELQRKCLFYLPGGAKAGTYLPASGFMAQNNFLDINADGLDEVLVSTETYPAQPKWSAFRLGLPPVPVPGLDGKELWQIFDANGDGCADVLTAADEYIDVRKWQAVTLQYPPGFAQAGTCFPGYAAGGRFIGEQWVVAVSAGVEVGYTALFLFTPDGKCLLYEELGEDVRSLACWTYGEADHLVVCTSNRVLVYP